jgi:Carboxypeptidase regulatory-like domain
MHRYVNPLLLLMAATACSAPTAPAPPTIYSLSGRVTEAGTAAGINAAVVHILDGPNMGRVATTDAGGNYSFSVLSPSAFTVMAAAPLFYEQRKAIDLTTSKTLSFELVGGAPATPSPWDY